MSPTPNSTPANLDAAARVAALIAEKNQMAVLTERETADWARLSIVTMRRMRWAGSGPRFVKLSEKRIGYRVADIIEWLDARTSKAA